MGKNLIIKNTIYKFITDLLRLLLPVISMPYIYRIFSPNMMGKIEFSRSIAGYFFMFSGFGVFTYGLREIARARSDVAKRNKIFTELFIISVLSSILLIIIYLLYIFIKFNDDILLKNMLLLNGIQLISYIFYIEWINEAFEDYNFISKKTTIIKVINLLCIFYFIKIGTDYYKYLFLINIFIFLNNFISFIYIRKYISFDFKNLKFRKYIFPLAMIVIMANASVLYTTLDKILLGFYINDIAEIAYYSVSQNITLILKTMLMSCIIVSVPRLSFYLGENKKEKYEKMLNMIIGFIFVLVFPISIGLIVLSKEIIYFFGGDTYLPGRSLLVIFSIRLVVIIIEEILATQVIFLNQKERIVALNSLVCGSLNVLIKIILIKTNNFNAWTAIVSTMFCESLLIVISYVYVKKYLKYRINIFRLRYVKYLLLSLIFFLVYYIINKLDLFYFTTSLITISICMLIYLIFLLILKDEYVYLFFERIRKNKE